MDLKHEHLRLKFSVSGAAETGHCGVDAYDKGLALGREIAKYGAILITGATTGFPLWAAMGAKEVDGFVLGFSPASTEKEHIETFNLPVEYHDIIVYTGFGYPGRDLILTRSSDAVFFGCGRIGTIHEFTISFEDQKPIGIYEADWGTDEVIKSILQNGHRTNDRIAFDTDPKKLVQRVADLVHKDKINRASFRFAPTDEA
ncbi:LOG family protein [Patescibacteria group bacterium]|nr:LOG family protein [Patescibacteria group bacterium]